MIESTRYIEKVYAGVLGKIIGVYLGRPFEGWTHERIIRELGEIRYYVHDRLGKPLVVTDDDISGTFTFFRAIEDNPEKGARITSQDVANTWLNYIIENRSILWWGGKGISTEHTAYLRLRDGIEAPRSGSIELNGRIVAEQIGAQIFIEGWGLVAPGDPERAVSLAGEAGRVSHDGEAVVGAQMIAAAVALAFESTDVVELVTSAAAHIDQKSLIRRVIGELIELRHKDADWRSAWRLVSATYGYDKYGGGVHIVPNHAIDIIGLLYSENSFQKGLMITNTCGWDTDCNSANVGCILGVLRGLDGINGGPDYRGPVADRMYLPTADGGRVITDAVQETYRIVNSARRISGLAPSPLDKGVRFNFSLPGSVQGFHLDPDPECGRSVTLENVSGQLGIRYAHLAPGAPLRVRTATFLPPEALAMPGYGLAASPTVYPGQKIAAVIAGRAEPGVRVGLFVQTYDPAVEHGLPRFVTHRGKTVTPGGSPQEIALVVPDASGAPITMVGIELTADEWVGHDGVLLVDHLGWTGTPSVTLFDPAVPQATHCNESWVQACDVLRFWDGMTVSQSRGVGLALNGTREWESYRLSAELVPRLFDRGGLVVGFHGLRRYLAALLTSHGTLQIVEQWDGHETVLSEAAAGFDWNALTVMKVTFGRGELDVTCNGRELHARAPSRLSSGAVGVLAESGSVQLKRLSVEAL